MGRGMRCWEGAMCFRVGILLGGMLGSTRSSLHVSASSSITAFKYDALSSIWS